MRECGFSVFTQANDYEAALGAKVILLPTRSGELRFRLSRVELPHLRLLRAEEASPRLAFVSLPSDRVVIVFPTRRTASLMCDGFEVEFGEMIVHSRAERYHTRTGASCSWGAIRLSPESLMHYSKILYGDSVAPPPRGCVLHPAPGDLKRMLRMHAEATGIAETQPDGMRHPEVARALNEDLIWTLVTCLAEGRRRDAPEVGRRRAEIVAELGAALIEDRRLLQVPDACRAIGVSERELRACCSHVLGMSARHYMLLHRRRRERRAHPDASAKTEARDG